MSPRYFIKIVIAVVVAIFLSLWIAHHTFDKPGTQYFNPASTSSVVTTTTVSVPAPSQAPRDAVKAETAAPVAPTTLPAPTTTVAPPLPPPNNTPAPPVTIKPIPGGYAYASPTISQQLVNGCPSSGVVTESSGYSQATPQGMDSGAGWQNDFCGQAQSGYEWCYPKITMPGEPVQTGLDYTRCYP